MEDELIEFLIWAENNVEDIFDIFENKEELVKQYLDEGH